MCILPAFTSPFFQGFGGYRVRPVRRRESGRRLRHCLICLCRRQCHFHRTLVFFCFRVFCGIGRRRRFSDILNGFARNSAAKEKCGRHKQAQRHRCFSFFMVSSSFLLFCFTCHHIFHRGHLCSRSVECVRGPLLFRIMYLWPHLPESIPFRFPILSQTLLFAYIKNFTFKKSFTCAKGRHYFAHFTNGFRHFAPKRRREKRFSYNPRGMFPIRRGVTAKIHTFPLATDTCLWYTAVERFCFLQHVIHIP